ncbi:tetratricopeptide repeat protein [Emcibacter nanhaiensis]|uniref:Tetratricopeptide repeat protein n=1 Tax=Emcibacter nanhaiensis TaxID=1505037 RepID=A0A501PS74_9PROT|nr:tetratricopeptide repeat protein [Emcibacter nanhaiensis]TPD62814.1 tetratricopeptide repeat protein [Emcibacter nanhaiensis]
MAKKSEKNSGTLAPARNRGQFNKYLQKGNQLFSRGEYSQALAFLNAAWNYDESNSQVGVQIANCLFEIGEKAKAINVLSYVWQKAPENSDVCTVIGGAATKMNFHDLALKAYEHYTRLNPNDPKGYVNFAAALKEIDQFDKAIDLLQNVIPIFPEHAPLWLALASVVHLRDGPEASLVFYEEAYRQAPDDRLVLYNLPAVYLDLGRLSDAKKVVQECISNYSEFSYPHLLYAKILMSEGNLQQGWEEYKWRHHPGSAASCVLPYDIPAWESGMDITGKTLLISAEQGVGDEILATPVYKQIVEQAGQVYIGCDERLVPLYKNSFPDAEITPFDVFMTPEGRNGRLYPDLSPEDIETIDYYCFCLDALANVWRKPEDIKPREKILLPSDAQTEKWRARLEDLPHKLNVGICWKSGTMHVQRQLHYPPLEYWLPLLQNGKVNFINVQYGDNRDELAAFLMKHDIEIHDFEDLDLKDDFDGTAALMSCLDLVIGPATTPVIQAGCTGTEVWWLTNGYPWWTFGPQDPPWLERGHIHAKDPNQPWPAFMTEMQGTFESWVTSQTSVK